MTESCNLDSKVHVLFDHDMYQTEITLDDLYLEIVSNINVKFSWTAEYVNSKELLITLSINSIIKGDETLKIRFINSKVFRGVYGGWVKPQELTTLLLNSLASSAESAKSISSYTEYMILSGIIVAFLLLYICGNSIEMIWSLVNTLQIITFLPLMTEYYPDHVKIMFEILEFVNIDFEFLSNMFASLLNIDDITANSYNSRFLENGIDSPLFLHNSASLIMTFLLTVIFICFLYLVYCTLSKFEKIKNKVGALISSYFFNNFLRFFVEGYLEIYFAAWLNVMARPSDSTAEIVSLSISWVVCLVFFIFPFMVGALLYDKQQEIADGHEIYLKRFGTMYKEFKTDREWYHIQYYSAFLIRRLIFIMFLIIMIDHSVLQCNWFIFFWFLVSVLIFNPNIDLLLSSVC